MVWRTFWLNETGRARRGLRRYARTNGDFGWTCADGWHEAYRWTGEEVDAVLTDAGLFLPDWPAPARDDPGWPSTCDRCGYEFGPDDHWQTWSERLWVRADTEELRVLHWSRGTDGAPVAEPGATWDAKWIGAKGPDGICLMVRCPRGNGSPGKGLDWCVDLPSTRSARPWTRSGDPRLAEVSASPSIAIGTPGEPDYYHGWLHDGVLSDHQGW